MATINVIELGLALFCITAFLLGPWRGIWIDTGRQELFVLRDKLFMLAANGSISFDDEAYKLLRDMLNGMIRFTHRFNVSTLLVMLWIVQKSDTQRESMVLKAIAKVPDSEVVRQLKELHSDAVRAQLAVASMRSPIGWLMILIGIPLYIFQKFSHRKNPKWLSRQFTKVKSVAELESKLAA